MKKCYKIFLLSDIKVQSEKLSVFLNQYEDYELHFLPSEMSLFEVYNLDPDIVILDKNINNVVNCYEWGKVA